LLPASHDPQWISINALSSRLGIAVVDIVETLRENKMLVRHGGRTHIYVSKALLRRHAKALKRYIFCDPHELILPELPEEQD
jgi:hypothetical protein